VKGRDIEEILTKTIQDGTISRGERQALRAVFRELRPDSRLRARCRDTAFRLARERLGRRSDATMEWLLEVTKVLHARETRDVPKPVSRTRAFFSPGKTCVTAIEAFVSRARKQLDICVFTITDDRLARAVLAAEKRGIAVRIITDNDKAGDRGSDARRLEASGIPLKTDQTSDHMHHKFAVADRKRLLTGSYNWTRGAHRNLENIIVSADETLAKRFQREFNRLWSKL
jgi:cardiolipin hydrolase